MNVGGAHFSAIYRPTKLAYSATEITEEGNL